MQRRADELMDLTLKSRAAWSTSASFSGTFRLIYFSHQVRDKSDLAVELALLRHVIMRRRRISHGV